MIQTISAMNKPIKISGIRIMIPMIVHWVLMLIGIGLTLPAAAWMLVLSLRSLSHGGTAP